MHILFIIDSLSPGGAERQLVELVKGLNRNGGYKISIGVLERSETGYAEEIHDLNIDENLFLRKSRLDFKPILMIRNYINTNAVDIVHGYLNLGAFYGTIAGKLAGRPVVCSSIRNAKDENIRTGVNIKIEARIADMLVSNSKAGFMNRFKALRPNFRVIYNGTDFDRFNDHAENSQIIKTQFQLGQFTHIIGMVATFSDYKDYESVLLSAQSVLTEYPSAGFLLIGDGPNLSRIKAMAAELNLIDRVVFPGHRRDVEVFYPIMDLCLLMTRTERVLEGISNSMVEAMACGVPVIASAGGGTDELIFHNETGIIVPPSNPYALSQAIIQLLNDKNKRKALSGKAKADVYSRFNLARYVQDHIAVYNELVPCKVID